MHIERFMRGYKAAWEARDEAQFCALFTRDGAYANTPFAEQRGHEQLARYWQRVKLQDEVQVDYDVLAAAPREGTAHWHVTYRIASEELFAVWAASAAGTPQVERRAGDPLPRMVLDGVLHARFDDDGLCMQCRLWWHSMPLP